MYSISEGNFVRFRPDPGGRPTLEIQGDTTLKNYQNDLQDLSAGDVLYGPMYRVEEHEELVAPTIEVGRSYKTINGEPVRTIYHVKGDYKHAFVGVVSTSRGTEIIHLYNSSGECLTASASLALPRPTARRVNKLVPITHPVEE